MASTPGFPVDEAAIDALQPNMVSLEWPTGEFVTALKTIVNEEHTAIMTREVSIDEGDCRHERTRSRGNGPITVPTVSNIDCRGGG